MNPELQLSDLPVEDILGICKHMNFDTLKNVIQTSSTFREICERVLVNKKASLDYLLRQVYDPRVVRFTIKYGGRSETYQPKIDTVDLNFEEFRTSKDGTLIFVQELLSTELIEHLRSLSDSHVEYVIEAFIEGRTKLFPGVLYD